MTSADARSWHNLRAALVSYAQSAHSISPSVAKLLGDHYRWRHAQGDRFMLLFPARRRRAPEQRYFKVAGDAHIAYVAAIRARGRVALDSHTFELFGINPDGSLRSLARSWGERRNTPARNLPLFA